MRVTNIKTVYLSEKEIKEAITCWMRVKNPFGSHHIVEHLKENRCTYDWEMRSGNIMFVISIDGEVVDEEPHLDNALHSCATSLPEFEDVIELYKTYGGD